MPSAHADSAHAVETRDLRVDYGERVAVDGLSLSVPPGEVFGLVGPNGAGKTSSFKVLATLMRPTYGDVFIGGIDIALRPEAARRRLGYMPDLAPAASDLKVWEFLDLFAAAHGLGGDAKRQRVGECLERVGLDDRAGAMCKELSRGMTQRLVLAKVLLHRPSLYLLDEPASGMDPTSRAALRETLRSLAAEGASVIVSSHILTELEDMCTMVGFMREGRLVDSGSVADVLARHAGAAGRTLLANVLGDPSPLLQFLDEREGTSPGAATPAGVEFTLAGGDADQADLLAAMVAAGLRVKSLAERRATMEQVLLDLETRTASPTQPPPLPPNR